jgi:hypothetical protein
VSEKREVKGRKFSSFAATMFGLQDTLLIMGYAIFGAAHFKRCSVSIYHVKLLSRLCALIVLCACSIFISTYQIAPRDTRKNKWVWVVIGFKIVASFVLAVISCYPSLFLITTQTPKISQPAMAVPGYCYTENSFTFRPNVQDKVGGNFEDFGIAGSTWVVFVVTMILFKYLVTSRKVVCGIGLGIIAMFVWMVVRLFQMWHEAQPYLQEGTSETDWGFGQVVSVILLIGPILTFFQTITGQCLLSYLLCFSTNKNS